MSNQQQVEVRRFRKYRPVEVCEAFLLEGTFPLDFLTEKEEARKAREPEYAVEIVDTRTGERLIRAREGEYIVRFPQLGLRNYPADSFEYGYEDVTALTQPGQTEVGVDE